MLIYSFIPILLLSITEVGASRSPPRYLDSHDLYGPDGSCNDVVSTNPDANGVAGVGIVFPIQSHVDNDDDVLITSLGFHVQSSDLSNGGKIFYEAYALSVEGLYADPNRVDGNTALTVDSTFDYRGELDSSWTLIAKGQISSVENLTQSITTANEFEPDFFQIPFETFTATTVPGNGGIRSFYITTNTSSFIYLNPPEDADVYDEVILIDGAGDEEYAPKVLIGEGLVTYPMPTQVLSYLVKSFVGSVYYEKECLSFAPSKSASPSGSPTNAASDSPSSSPTSTSAPTGSPTVAASDTPSSVPSITPTVKTEQVSDGLSVKFAIKCDPNEESSEQSNDAVAESVRKFVETGLRNPFMFGLRTRIVRAVCGSQQVSRHLGEADLAHDEAAEKRRHLPVSSSALDYSVVITGEYRPPSRPGETAPLKPPDLGTIAEDSINADPQGFVKDLKERAGEASPLSQVEASDLTVAAVEIVDGEFPQPEPTRMPTSPPTPEDNTDSILVICIVITVGIFVLLGAFLLFRHAERRAAKKRRQKMARVDEKRRREKERVLDKQDMVEWEDLQAVKGEKGSWNKKEKSMKGGTMVYERSPPPAFHGGAAPSPQSLPLQ